MIFKSVQIDQYVKTQDKNIRSILIYGSNEGLIRDTVKRITQSICEDLTDAFRISKLLGTDLSTDIGLLYGEFNSQSLLGGRRVIIVNEAGNDLSKHIRKMLDESPKEGNLLILVGSSSLNKKSSLVRLAEESSDMASFACYEDKEEDIRGMLKKMGLTFEPAAIQLLCGRLSGDHMINQQELNKLATYMGTSKNVTIEIVNNIISDTSDSSLEDIYYSTFSGKKNEALSYYSRYLYVGNEASSVARGLNFHLQKLLFCQGEIEKGKTADQAMQQLIPRIIFYRAESFKHQLYDWKRDKILRAMELVYEAEKNCKTTNMPAEEIVSLLLLRLASAAKRNG